MTMINDASESPRANAANPVMGRRQRKSNPKGARKAVKGKTARQKANQSNQKPSRSFRLTSEALKELRAESGKGFVNPYRESSTYHACTAALRKLGTGRFHALDKIIPAVIGEMGEAAAAFKSKKNRSDTTGKDWKERVIQNVKVLARPDYGAKLRQLGFEVRTDSVKGAGLFKR
jgi:hypothetical protein